ncbi:MAG TPA: hypothetical protein VNT32_08175 [Thermoleophilaceae bacterium]|nr:hypothetical protein [Thermoleophilaceae bacterium]
MGLDARAEKLLEAEYRDLLALRSRSADEQVVWRRAASAGGVFRALVELDLLTASARTRWERKLAEPLGSPAAGTAASGGGHEESLAETSRPLRVVDLTSYGELGIRRLISLEIFDAAMALRWMFNARSSSLPPGDPTIRDDQLRTYRIVAGRAYTFADAGPIRGETIYAPTISTATQFLTVADGDRELLIRLTGR